MKKLLFLALTLMTSLSFANPLAGTYTVKSIRVSDATGYTYVYTTAPVQHKNTSCTETDAFAISRDAKSYDHIFSSLLTAAASGQQVQIWVAFGNGDCLNNRQRIALTEVNFQ
ncbi:hypothetical protein CWB99_11840 [Pseudoalteromonas rubra]|uniref:Uncharacterized protein n=1 Tax=Pseudoalteromonas rubra TaxID=43658 RepID=A0A5S3WLI2_9GAMM|nr:hypothetical protein [Pseudoalteromonas rubra]TMP28401.1 hypothetical protein CWB99_11840 [Pseudoalteromonas rubra]TMP37196.1 hypothetical protein CWC00_00155 [Pseudoalteromonas rubra]